MKNKIFLSLLVCLGLFFAFGEALSPKPNFSGKWKFNAAKSKLQIPAPETGIFILEHRDPEFRLSRTFVSGGKEDTFSIDLKSDGKTLTADEKFRGPILKYDNIWILDKE